MNQDNVAIINGSGCSRLLSLYEVSPITGATHHQLPNLFTQVSDNQHYIILQRLETKLLPQEIWSLRKI